MVFACQFAISLANFFLIGFFVHAENLIIIFIINSHRCLSNVYKFVARRLRRRATREKRFFGAHPAPCQGESRIKPSGPVQQSYTSRYSPSIVPESLPVVEPEPSGPAPLLADAPAWL